MISIVLPVYNAARFLRPTVQMVLAQTCGEWELIAVDDGSTDATPALLQAFARQDSRIRVVTQANGGCAAARNTGRNHAATGAEYVIFLDHDDLWEPDALETLLRVARARPEAVAVMGQVAELPDAEADSVFVTLQRKAALPREQAAVEAPDPLLISDPITFADNAIACCAGTMGQVLIRRDALAQTGPLNVECVPCDDWELYLRLGLLGAMARTERNVIWWRSHASNTSKNHKRMYNAEMRVRQCLLARAGLTPEQRRQVRDGFQVGKKRLAAQQRGYAWEALRRRQFGNALRQLRYALRNYARSFQSVPAPSVSTPAISSNSVS